MNCVRVETPLLWVSVGSRCWWYVCEVGAALRSWCIGGMVPWKLPVPFLLFLLSFITPSCLINQQVPPPPLCLLPSLPLLPSQQSDHLSTLLPPPPSVFPLSFTLMSLSLALVGCCGQTSRSNLALPLFLCLSFLSLHWLSISCALSLLSNFCLCLSSQIYFLLFPLLVSVNSVSYGSEIVSIVFITMCGRNCVDKKIDVLYAE